MLVRGHADGLQADVVDARAAPGGHEQLLATQLTAVIESQDALPVTSSVIEAGADRLRAEFQLDPVPAQHRTERLTQPRGLMSQHVPVRCGHHHLPAEAPYGLGHFHPDRSGAEDQQPARHCFHSGDLAVGPQPGQLAQAGDGMAS